MSCLQTLSIKDKNGKRFNVPCGRCHDCLSKRRNDWSFRLYQEMKVSYTSKFITLTYDDEHIYCNTQGLPSLNKEDVQKFLKRLREAQNTEYKKLTSGYTRLDKGLRSLRKDQIIPKGLPKIRYYLCGEYGEQTQRPHYHIIIFNMLPSLEAKITEIWKNGTTHIAECNVKTIAYTTKYALKNSTRKAETDLQQKPFSLMSRKPALGDIYLQANRNYHRKKHSTTVVNKSGGIQRLPRYYKDKIFNRWEQKYMSDLAIKASDKNMIEESERLIRLGNNVAAYQLTQLRRMIYKQKVEILKSDKL